MLTQTTSDNVLTVFYNCEPIMYYNILRNKVVVLGVKPPYNQRHEQLYHFYDFHKSLAGATRCFMSYEDVQSSIAKVVKLCNISMTETTEVVLT